MKSYYLLGDNNLQKHKYIIKYNKWYRMTEVQYFKELLSLEWEKVEAKGQAVEGGRSKHGDVRSASGWIIRAKSGVGENEHGFGWVWKGEGYFEKWQCKIF